ncbi:SCP1 Transgelin [Candida maltosa Xu316]
MEPPQNLDQELTSSRLSRYNAIQQEVKKYLHDTISPHFPDLFTHKFSTTSSTSYLSNDLCELLKDGEVLCKLGQLVPITANPTSKFKNAQMAFIQMENISFFLKLCEAIKLPHDEIFQTVCVTLMSFSRIVHDLDPKTFPNVIGPKIVKVKPNVPTKPYKLRA